jgi:hypothetical protein
MQAALEEAINEPRTHSASTQDERDRVAMVAVRTTQDNASEMDLVLQHNERSAEGKPE